MVDDLFLETGVFEYDGAFNEGAEVKHIYLDRLGLACHYDVLCGLRIVHTLLRNHVLLKTCR